MVDLQAAREAFYKREISKIGWIRRDKNVADALIKPVPYMAMLHYLNLHRPDGKPLKSVVRDAPAQGLKKYLLSHFLLLWRLARRISPGSRP